MQIMEGFLIVFQGRDVNGPALIQGPASIVELSRHTPDL